MVCKCHRYVFFLASLILLGCLSAADAVVRVSMVQRLLTDKENDCSLPLLAVSQFGIVTELPCSWAPFISLWNTFSENSITNMQLPDPQDPGYATLEVCKYAKNKLAFMSLFYSLIDH